MNKEREAGRRPLAAAAAPEPAETLQRRVAGALAARIAEGAWPPGARLPAERALCEEYGVSRITVRAALAALAQRGLLARRQGRGTFVAAPGVPPGAERDLNRAYSFRAELRRRGLDSRKRVLGFSLEAAPAAVRDKLGLGRGEQVFRLVRLWQVGGEPFAWECSYIPFFLAPVMSRSQIDREGGLYSTIRALSGCAVSRVEESFGALGCPAGPARLLGVAAGAAVLRVERVAFSGGQRVEYRESLMRSDKTQYKVVLD